MVQRIVQLRSRNTFYYLTLAFAVVGFIAIACGVKAGENRPARPQGQIEEFHRTQVSTLEQLRVNLVKDDTGCTADPADITVALANRVRLAIQLPADIQQGASQSLIVVGDGDEVTYQIAGMELATTGGALGTGVKEFDQLLSAGARKSFDFNVVNPGAYDILCDGEKVGVFTVTE